MRLYAALALVLLLAACGFQLRGQGPGGAFPYAQAQVAGDGPVAEQLRQNLRLLDSVQLVSAAQSGVARIDLLGERRERKVGALDNDGRVAEYRLFYILSYRVATPDGEELINTSELRQFRDYTYDENNALGNDAQEQMLLRDMQQAMAQQILRRVNALARQQPTDAPAVIQQGPTLDAR